MLDSVLLSVDMICVDVRMLFVLLVIVIVFGLFCMCGMCGVISMRCEKFIVFSVWVVVLMLLGWFGLMSMKWVDVKLLDGGGDEVVFDLDGVVVFCGVFIMRWFGLLEWLYGIVIVFVNLFVWMVSGGFFVFWLFEIIKNWVKLCFYVLCCGVVWVVFCFLLICVLFCFGMFVLFWVVVLFCGGLCCWL